MHMGNTVYENTVESYTIGYENWDKILILQIPKDLENLMANSTCVIWLVTLLDVSHSLCAL